MLMHWNEHLFLLWNAPQHPAILVAIIAEVAAQWAVFAAVALVPALWIWGDPSRRVQLLAVFAGVSCAVGINQLLGMLWFEPRPFMLGLGHTLVQHAPDNSFPSDHATFMWGLGFSLIATNAARRWGAVVALIGLVVAWARIYVGVHYPIDMAASFLVALVGTAISCALVGPAERWIAPGVERLYLRLQVSLHLPSRLFPRQASMPRIGAGVRGI